MRYPVVQYRPSWTNSTQSPTFLDSRDWDESTRCAKKAETAIERLQEHRTAIITAAVTGKIDVREVAPEPVAAATGINGHE